MIYIKMLGEQKSPINKQTNVSKWGVDRWLLDFRNARICLLMQLAAWQWAPPGPLCKRCLANLHSALFPHIFLISSYEHTFVQGSSITSHPNQLNASSLFQLPAGINFSSGAWPTPNKKNNKKIYISCSRFIFISVTPEVIKQEQWWFHAINQLNVFNSVLQQDRTGCCMWQDLIHRMKKRCATCAIPQLFQSNLGMIHYRNKWNAKKKKREKNNNTV